VGDMMLEVVSVALGHGGTDPPWKQKETQHLNKNNIHHHCTLKMPPY